MIFVCFPAVMAAGTWGAAVTAVWCAVSRCEIGCLQFDAIGRGRDWVTNGRLGMNVREMVFVILASPLIGPLGLLVSCWIENGWIGISLGLYEIMNELYELTFSFC